MIVIVCKRLKFKFFILNQYHLRKAKSTLCDLLNSYEFRRKYDEKITFFLRKYTGKCR
jgi:hypothetical protein